MFGKVLISLKTIKTKLLTIFTKLHCAMVCHNATETLFCEYVSENEILIRSSILLYCTI